MNYAVIMAGGTGKRLWPLSRQKRPKQVLKLLNGQTLLGSCFERLTPIFDSRNIIVLTNVDYVDLVREELDSLPSGNVIAEPAVRDTAGAIALAATVLTKHNPEATMAVVTADQVIKPTEILQKALRDAIAFVNRRPEALVTFGIKPTFPSTQLGYIRCGQALEPQEGQSKIVSVEAFREKPDRDTAEEYLRSGQYLWNSGLFVWKARTILDNLARFLPESIGPLDRIASAWGTPDQDIVLKEWFVRLPKISIDFAVMEKAQSVYAIGLDCQWLDMGSFASLADVVKPDETNNIVVAGTSELLDCKDNIVVTEDEGHLIAAIGLDGIVIAHTPDATLICHAKQTDRLKELLALIERQGRKEFL